MGGKNLSDDDLKSLFGGEKPPEKKEEPKQEEQQKQPDKEEKPKEATPPPKEEVVKPEPKQEEKQKSQPMKTTESDEESSSFSGEFDFSSEKDSGKRVFCIYANKGDGKTTVAMTIDGKGTKIACLSFDHKSSRIREELYRKGIINKEDIIVFNAVRYWNQINAEKVLETSDTTLRYINSLLDKFSEIPEVIETWGKDARPDYVLVDGSEIAEQIAEYAMRSHNNLMPFQGISNRNVWKQRKMFLKQLHNKAMSLSKKGVIYTTYVVKDKIVADGDEVVVKDVPRWVGVILYETDVVIRVESDQKQDGREFIATIESSKVADYKTGIRKDITNKTMETLKE